MTTFEITYVVLVGRPNLNSWSSSVSSSSIVSVRYWWALKNIDQFSCLSTRVRKQLFVWFNVAWSSESDAKKKQHLHWKKYIVRTVTSYLFGLYLVLEGGRLVGADGDDGGRLRCDDALGLRDWSLPCPILSKCLSIWSTEGRKHISSQLYEWVLHIESYKLTRGVLPDWRLEAVCWTTVIFLHVLQISWSPRPRQVTEHFLVDHSVTTFQDLLRAVSGTPQFYWKSTDLVDVGACLWKTIKWRCFTNTSILTIAL